MTEKLYRFQSIDILKCLAILMVLTVHQGQMFKNCGLYEFSKLGQLGCQCFFVISGFTLCQSWDTRKSTKRQFFQKRFKAIAPGYWFDILLFTLISSVMQFFNLPHYWHQPGGWIPGWGHIMNFLMIHGISPQWINTIVPGGWYVGTIMLMYLTFPAMKKMLEWCSRKSSLHVMIMPWIFAGLSVGFWFFMSTLYPDVKIGNNTFVYFNIFSQYPCFVIGGALYTYVCSHGSHYNINLKKCITIACVFCVCSILLFYNGDERYFCLVPICASSFFGCLLLILLKLIDYDGMRLPDRIKTICTKIAGVSYEMYLLHTLFAYFFVWCVRKVLTGWGFSWLFDYSISFVAALLLLILFSYYSGKLLNRSIKKIIK